MPIINNIPQPLNGCKGSISVVGTGGIAPYTFWLTGQETRPVVSGMSAVFTLLDVGNYVVHTKDSNNCEVTNNVTITKPTQITYTTSIIGSISIGGIDQETGELVINASGGTPPYQYSLDSFVFQPSNTFTNLPAGSYYNCYIIDSNDCNRILTTQIIPAIPATEVITLDNVFATNEYNTAGTSIGQTFLNNTANYITGVIIKLFNGNGVSGTQTMELKLFSGDTFNPVDLLATTTDTCTNALTLMEFNFNTPIPVNTGEMYCFEITNKFNANGVGYPNDNPRVDRFVTVGGYGYGNGVLSIRLYQYSFQIKGII